MRISGVTYTIHKTNHIRPIITIVAIVLFLALSLLVGMSAYSSWKLLHPAVKETEAFSSNIVPEYSEASFMTEDKIRLSGWYFKAKTSGRAVILVHPYGSTRLPFGDKTVYLIKKLLSEGYSVLSYDSRACGKSAGEIVTFGALEQKDIAAAVQWSKRQGSKEIALIGFSTGASAAIMAAEGNDAIKAVVADSPYSNLRTWLEGDLHHWTGLPAFPFNRTTLFFLELFSGIDAKKASPVDAVQNGRQTHLLLIHGKYNDRIGIENSKKLLHLAASDTDIWETEAGGLTVYPDQQEEYISRVLSFLSSAFVKQQP